MVEFVLILPVALLLGFGILALVLAMSARNAVQQAEAVVLQDLSVGEWPSVTAVDAALGTGVGLTVGVNAISIRYSGHVAVPPQRAGYLPGQCAAPQVGSGACVQLQFDSPAGGVRVQTSGIGQQPGQRGLLRPPRRCQSTRACFEMFRQ
jgi:hypothetical protein